MLIQNTSYMFDASLEEEFVAWMKNKFIPLLQETNTFKTHHFCKVMVTSAEGGLTYSLQLVFPNEQFFERYRLNFEPRTSAVFSAKYHPKILHFSSVLKEV